MSYIIDGLMNCSVLFIFLVVIQILTYIFYKKHSVTGNKGFWVGWQLFACLIIMIFAVTNAGGINEVGSFGSSIIRLDEINLIPFRWVDGYLFGLIMNMVMFIPVGIVVPLIWQNNNNLKYTALCGFIFSLLIEISQLFNFRATDIDDILMNTLGAVIGYGIYYLLLKKIKLFQVNNDKGNWMVRNSSLITLFIIFIFYFFIGKPILSYAMRLIYGY